MDNTTILAALIGAVAVVLAALIPIIIRRRSLNALKLKILIPEGLDVSRANNSFQKLRDWQGDPVRQGENKGSGEYPIKEQVLSKTNTLDLSVKVWIDTNQPWPQGEYDVEPDGTFSGHVYLDRSRPPMILRFDLLKHGGTLKSFATKVN